MSYCKYLKAKDRDTKDIKLFDSKEKLNDFLKKNKNWLRC